MNEAIERLAQVSGEGGDGKVSADELSEYKQALDGVARRSEEWASLRAECLRARFNRWGGQSIDGRKWGKNTGFDPEPFDGCSDQRVWWIDQIVREQETLRVVALERATLRCEPRNGAQDDRVARALTVLLQWLRDRLGAAWYEEHRKLTQYELGDSPAVALMRVWWRREHKLAMRQMDAQGLVGLWMQEYGQGAQEDPGVLQNALAEFVAALTGPEEDQEALAEMLRRFFPRLTAARARRVVREIRERGEAEFPVPQIAFEGPAIQARRFVEDFVVPDNTRDFDRCPMWFEPEWLTKAELLERQATDGWNKTFVDEVLKAEGRAAIPEYEEREGGWLRELDYEDHKGAYQVVRVWTIAANEDGIPAKYHVVIHPDSDRTAYGRRLYRSPCNHWPAVFHRREIVDKWLLNSRSVAEIEGPAQYGVKLLRDVAVDNANIGGLPPFVTYGHSQKGSIDLGPLAHLPVRQGGDAKFMQPPAFPAAARQVAEDMLADRDRYWGRPVEDVDPVLAAMQREADTALFMERVREELQLILDLALMNMPGDEIVRILDQEGAQLADIPPADLAGQYDVRIVFDPADLDVKSVIDRCQALKDVLMALDVDKTIDASRYVEHGVRALFPQLAGDGLRPAQEGLRKELEDEQQNYMKLRAGVMPQMNTEGAWNYQARRQMYEEMMQANPDVFSDMPPDKAAGLQQWLTALEQQATQFGENVGIGRTGAAGVQEE